jgi:hypothetical protein
MTRSRLSTKAVLLATGIGLSMAAFVGSQPAAAQSYSYTCPSDFTYDPTYGCVSQSNEDYGDYGYGYPYGTYGLRHGEHRVLGHGFDHGMGGGVSHGVRFAHFRHGFGHGMGAGGSIVDHGMGFHHSIVGVGHFGGVGFGHGVGGGFGHGGGGGHR